MVVLLLAFAFVAGCSCNRQDHSPAPVAINPSTEPKVPLANGVDEPKVDKGEAPKDAIDIFVVAKQWIWKFQHPDGQREIGELRVPAGKPFKLTAISEDVIHRLSIPELKIKLDAVPAKYTTDWTTVAKPGR